MSLLSAIREVDQVIREHEKLVASLPHSRFQGDTKHELHHTSNKYFHYIPLGTHMFIKVLVPLLRGKRSFLDVGCGMGDKLALVHKICPKMHVGGIEFHKPYVEKARELAPYAEVFHKDAFKFTQFRRWDLIYAYRPISDCKLMGELEEQIMRRMVSGATFVIFGPTRESEWSKERLLPHKDEDHGYSCYSSAYVYKKP